MTDVLLGRDVRPGEGPEFVHPDMVPLEQVREAVGRLLAQAVRPRVERVYDGTFGGQTDAGGNLQVLIFNVPLGMDFNLYRIVIDAAGATPQAPIDAGYLQICDGQPGTLGQQAALSSVRDFAPTSGNGQLFPQLSVDGEDSAATYKSGAQVWLNLVGTTARLQIAGYFKGLLREQ